jgi:phosphoglycerate dehydrogenase-like enzyme
VSAIRRTLGRGWDVRQVTVPGVSDGDGAAPSPDAVTAARGAEVYFGWGVSAAVIAAATDSLRWVHSAAAGVGASITPALLASDAVFTNSRGIHAAPISDWVVAAVAFCARGFHTAAAAQRDGQWAKGAFTDGTVPLRELSELTVGIIGLGGIGSAIARRCGALGMTVRAIDRRPVRRRPAGVVWVGRPRDLHRLARASDILVIAAPHTAETRNLVDADVLAALPRGAYVINVSRGALLDEEALLAALDSGHVQGCVLDVFAAEPLPRDHRFWTHPGVFLTPHVSGVTERFWERETALILENIRRYRAGKRLVNIVDLHAGY